jgi:uncharacterized membrane protein YfcA
MPPRLALNTLVGFAVGIAGGLIGLGGAELRLPYLLGYLRLTPHEAVRINLAVSLFTVAAAIPARIISLSTLALGLYLPVVIAIAAGAVIAAYLGAGWLKHLSAHMLGRLISGLLVILGLGLIAEAAIGMDAIGLLPKEGMVPIVTGVLFGFLIGAISSLLGVAGGEVIIPTLVFAYGVPIKAAGSLSMMISLPTVLVGLARHYLSGTIGRWDVILPMGIASAIGAITGGLLVAYAPATLLKVTLGVLLIWSAWKTARKH